MLCSVFNNFFWSPDKNLVAMSEYSLDSLESIEEDSLEKHVSANSDNDDKSNLNAVKSDDKLVENTSFNLNPILATSSPKKDNMAEANGIQQYARGDRCASTTGGRNSIIANGRGFTRRQRRRQECRAARDESWLCIRKRNDVVEGHEEEDDAIRRRRRRRRTSRPTTERRSPGARNSSSKCSLRNSRSDMRADKKLDNVFASRTQSRGPAGTVSYLELYRRRFSILKCPHIRSPEGSTLSICGDSQLEELSLGEGRPSLPGTSRDDSSELSFYRRFVKDQAGVTRTTRSCETSRRGTPSNTVFSGVKCERSVSDSKLKKPKYRPYTIEEYRSLSVSRPDRSLGPDKDEVQAKREWLMRRRSYGDSVSVRNRELILQQTRKLKTRRAIAQKCFLPSLKDRDDGASKDRENLRIVETVDATQKSLLKRPARYRKGTVTANQVSKSETLEKTSSFDSSFVSHAAFEDLEMLQQRHLQEKELADRLMRQALNS
ncbi:uncharacterized protein [Linepithema humile]|uniref:uncharacterized protein n=1 Tax=Linepithema humile TaxID=83485 RepID=UPI00351F459F